MTLRRSILPLLAASLAVATQSEARDCGCSDLPQMVQTVIEQEFLRETFERFATYGPGTVDAMQARAQELLNAAHGVKAAPGAAGQRPAPSTDAAHPELGTQYWDPSCPIVEYVYDGKGQAVLDKDGNHQTRPIKPESYQSKSCRQITDYFITHEQHHVKTCHETHRNGQQSSWKDPSFFAREDAAAYRAGLEKLRASTADLARRCGWSGSTSPTTSAGMPTVPTPDSAGDLSKRAAAALDRARSRR